MTERWQKLKRFIVLRVLHANDPPHALALGLAIGVFVAMTPTIGAQMVIAAAIAASFRANKILAMAAVWISNPVTMVQIYYVNWRIGQHFVETGVVDGESAVQAQITKIIESIGGMSNLFFHLLDKAFWSEVLRLVWALGIELWIGSFLVGLICALPTYAIARWMITAYRRRVPRPRFRRKAARRSETAQPLPGARPQLRKPPA
ncbi:MAG: DUF2062 domain-containing protein [Planctomycetes bacterium]|nr:DUF2062 domain-containing protein [Planctomycetota bacterium]